MYIIIFVIYLLLLIGMYALFGMGGGSFENLISGIVFFMDILILLFGIFATIVWGKKSFLKQESYKRWFYLSMGSIIAFLLVTFFLPLLNQ